MRDGEQEIDPAAVRLPEDLGMYIDELRADFDAIDEVWLLGDRVDGEETRDAPWEFLLFADAEVLEELRKSSDRRRSDTRVFVVVDGDRIESPWGDDGGARSLRDLRWRISSPQIAAYAGTGGERCALRMR